MSSNSNAAEAEESKTYSEFLWRYPIQLSWPAHVYRGASSSSSTLRTSKDLIQHRLLEHGVLYEVPTRPIDVVLCANRFVQDMNRTGCYDAVRVVVGGALNDSNSENDNNSENDGNSAGLRTIAVELDEKNWYRLHAGAGLKSSSTTGVFGGGAASLGHEGSSNSFLPTPEFDVSIGLRNLSGVTDQTSLNYSVDANAVSSSGSPSWVLLHSRPLYSVLRYSVPYLHDKLISEVLGGSQYQLSARAALETLDHEVTRGYKEYQRSASVTVSNLHNVTAPLALQMTRQSWYGHVEWSCLYRDVIPRRHPTLPYAFNASPAIVSAAGPSLKNSLSAVFHYNSPGMYAPGNNLLLPSHTASQFQGTVELATPPGDIGFIKAQAAASQHYCPSSSPPFVTFHFGASAGYLHPLSFGGLCNGGPIAATSNRSLLSSKTNTHISDRFFLGGSSHFRGFAPAGIGPRASTVAGAPGGNSLGGDFFYTATAAASVPLKALEPTASESVALSGVRLFCFGTVGTCTSIESIVARNKQIQHTSLFVPVVTDALRTTRFSMGVGLATTIFGPRIEITYALQAKPFSYHRSGPHDNTKQFQFGVSFTSM